MSELRRDSGTAFAKRMGIRMLGGGLKPKRNMFRRFVDDTSGAITAFTMVVFMLMVISVGMAIDFMRHEAYRAELQNALDRGVLAAASLTQTMPAKATVKSYVKSTTFVDKEYKLDVSANNSGKSRKVTALAEYQATTFFLRLIGIPELTVAAYSAATEGVKGVEVSFAIDISDSMGASDKIVDVTAKDFEALGKNITPTELGWPGSKPTRLQLMKTVTNKFIDDLLAGDAKETVSVSIVPYAGGVNPGKHVFSKYVKSVKHEHSTCLQFEPIDYTSYAPPATSAIEQMGHFQPVGFQPGEVDWASCPADNNRILYLTNNADRLKSHVNGLRAHAGTAAHTAMKYALTLLNPKSQKLVEELANKGLADKAFFDRPYKFGSDASVKVAILVTDGLTQHEYKPKTWNYDEKEEIDFLATHPNEMISEEYPNNQNSENLGWRIRNRNGLNGTRADLKALCKAARDEGVIVFTIAVDAFDDMPPGALPDMQACATPGYFYHVATGSEWIDAMKIINAKILSLRVVAQ